MAAPIGSLSKMFDDDANVLRFSEQELSEVLGLVAESRADPMSASPVDLGALGLDALQNASLHLQFQPASPVGEGSSTAAQQLDSFRPPSASDQHAHIARIIQQHQGMPGQPGMLASASVASAMQSFLPPGGNYTAAAFPSSSGSMQHAAGGASTAHRVSGGVDKPQVSHSSVEKQRRDRINSLIDELRDLVPPQKGNQTALPGGSRSNDGSSASAEARRPKHVVLADTITLLKNWKLSQQMQGAAAAAAAAAGPSGQQQAQQQQQPQGNSGAVAAALAAQQAAAMAAAAAALSIKEDPEGRQSAAGGTSLVAGSAAAANNALNAAASDVAPLMPNIPMSISSFAGVTVERAAELGIMYVQVKCRDRRGLLSDIINALKALPIEIRTAAVVTSGDGMVRDVFEIRVDDPELTAEAVQNTVHDGLYHQMSLRSEDGSGKRHKA